MAFYRTFFAYVHTRTIRGSNSDVIFQRFGLAATTSLCLLLLLAGGEEGTKEGRKGLRK